MANYYTLLTPTGLAKITNAQLTSSTIALTHVAVGDAGGAPYQPTGKETALKGEKWRGGIASVDVDANNTNWIVVDAVLPASVGGFTLREVALYDSVGDLIAIGNYPETYKPVISDGSTMDLVLRTIIEVNNTDSVTLKIDPNVIVASRKYVDDKVAKAVGDTSVIIGGLQTQVTTHLDEIATTTKLGHIMPDGVTIKVDPVTGVASGASTVDTSKFVLTDGTRKMDNITVGNRQNAVGQNSSALGDYVEASGRASVALCSYSKARGYAALASGESSVASGNYSTTAGIQTEALNYASTAIGSASNMTLANATSFIATADAFVIGNGNNTQARSNAFRVTFDGKAYGKAAFNSTGADYAEFFEWSDGNINSEDRVGYVVTLDGDKIRKALPTDDYILGIISVNPSVIGDSFQEDWQAKYVTDNWGRIQYETVDLEYDTGETDDVGNRITELRPSTVPKFNPDWNSDEVYISREERKEWDAVGLMGKLLVRDDGTCTVNSYAKVGQIAGELTASDEITNMRVIERVSDNIVRVFIK